MRLTSFRASYREALEGRIIGFWRPLWLRMEDVSVRSRRIRATKRITDGAGRWALARFLPLDRQRPPA